MNRYIMGFFSVFPACAGVIPDSRMMPEGSDGIPRMRGGDPRSQVIGDDRATVFPACAGVIPMKRCELWIKMSIPRMRGGDPIPKFIAHSAGKYSPHARG